MPPDLSKVLYCRATLRTQLSERSPAPLRQATKKVRMISRLLIMVQDSIIVSQA